ncbi:hypothetical protein BXY57_0053 [Thermoflavifilum aggregans]|uniref:Uncharacterized protein n=1 Tax=Thermoflavifilum aggregans TaxID=454188 RepID=A0A2M9CRN1_9BACT|nr:hypothetical protein [Thermoflavifilum aggregans]PJJ74495.1 hypothetical protein BXY57_0053 [Thermoflavifilum aggregans]
MRGLAAILVLAILLQTFSKGVIILDYRINIRYIATHLCVNRDRPELHCNGKCFLKKQLEKDQHRDASNGSSEKNILDINYCTDHASFVFPIFNSSPIHFSELKSSLPVASLDNVFHPPIS